MYVDKKVWFIDFKNKKVYMLEILGKMYRNIIIRDYKILFQFWLFKQIKLITDIDDMNNKVSKLFLIYIL